MERGRAHPGTDPELRDEVVVFTAHLDHVGIGAPDAQGDSIYNGTHDNAVGVAKVLAAAEAMVGLDMARSVLFLAMGAEEGGLLGSWYYVRNPVFPMEKTVAAINHDGGLDGQASDDFLAFGEEYSTLGPFLEQAGEEYGTSYERYRIPPFAAAQALLFRSDQYSFLLAGVPGVYLMPGFTVDGNRETNRQAWQYYLDNVNHQQRDNFLPDASWEAPVAMSAMSVYLVRNLANSLSRPEIQPDAPFRKTRASPDAPAFYGIRRCRGGVRPQRPLRHRTGPLQTLLVAQRYRLNRGTVIGLASNTWSQTRRPTASASLMMLSSSIVRTVRSRMTNRPSIMTDSMSPG